MIVAPPRGAAAGWVLVGTPQLPTRQRAALVAVAAAAVVLGAVAWALLLSSPRSTAPAVRAPLTVLGAWSFVAAGLVAVVSRPANRTGRLLVLTGFLLLVGALGFSEQGWTFTLGNLVSPLAQAVFVHLLLAFPEGRLHSRGERALVLLAYLDATVVELV